MLRRRIVNPLHSHAAAATAVVAASPCCCSSSSSGSYALLTGRRAVSSRGQFNPIHDFSVSFGKHEGAAAAPAASSLRFARDEKEFERLIVNPGPVRVGYSPDYLNWMYLAYQSKVAYELESQKKLQRRSSGAADAGQSSSSAGGSSAAAVVDAEASFGRYARPPSSALRRGGEAKKAASQRVISQLARKQGLYDLIERQPQFPVVDLSNATRFHFVELFKRLVMDYYDASYFNMATAGGSGDGDGEFSFAQEVWDKALLYRAIVEERKGAYPATKAFKTAIEASAQVNLSPRTASSSSSSPDAPASSSARALADRCPTEESYLYMRYLAKKYLVENAVEGHVVLKSHRQPNAGELLFCSPPPKDDVEVLTSIVGKGNGEGAAEAPTPEGANAPLTAEELKRIVAGKPGKYPPIDALWRCEENLPLLKVLVFAELNLFVSENPFAKFPNALSFLTRPYASSSVGGAAADAEAAAAGGSGRSGGGGRQNRQRDALSLANIISERRGTALAPIPRNVANQIDARGSDIRRQQQRFHREDILALSKMLHQHSVISGGAAGSSSPSSAAAATSSSSSGTGGSDDAFFYGAYADFNYYNPRTTRAERRDYLSRKTIAALKKAREADDAVYRRVGVEEVQSNQQFSRLVEGLNTLPVHLPTLPHYVALIKKDPHVSYLLHVGAGTAEGAAELERLTFQLARALYSTALHFHKAAVRRINRQKVNVASALLDAAVERQLAAAKQSLLVAATATAAAAGGSSDRGGAGVDAGDALRVLSSLGPYRKFEGRAIDESGYTTDARADDYQRWMRAPSSTDGSSSS